MNLYKFQKDGLEETKDLNKVAYYWDMGTGKTFVGAEKLIQLGAKINLVICQKSKIDDWIEHFKTHYPMDITLVDATKNKIDFVMKSIEVNVCPTVIIINYELAFRRKELLQLRDFTLLLDESSLIQNEQAKRTKFILKMQPKNVILLSGTPTGGKYETLWSQLHLLGWNISKDLFYRQYVDFHYENNNGFPLMVIDGYKNVERLKLKLKEYGARFLKTDEVFDLPEQVFNTIYVNTTKEYREFKKNRIVEFEWIAKKKSPEIKFLETRKFDPYGIADGNTVLVGDTVLTKMLYERMLCGVYNQEKLEALKDLIESTEDRLIIFYNFWDELYAIQNICKDLNRPISVVNGQNKDLLHYETFNNSITLIQYQAGSMGLNLQKANKIIYFTPPLSSELFEQSKKRTHRIGQNKTCFYYRLICKNSIEEKIYETLNMRKDYTEELFRKEEE